MMSGGVRRANSRITDVSAVIGAGPFSLAPGQTQQVCFVLSAGSNYDDISASTLSARRAARDMGLHATEHIIAPSQDRILHVDKLPVVSPGATTVVFSIAAPSPVQIDIVDLMGRSLATVVYELNVAAGSHTRSIQIPSVASGTYFFRMTTYRGSTALVFGIGR
jgi:hypothetical protein